MPLHTPAALAPHNYRPGLAPPSAGSPGPLQLRKESTMKPPRERRRPLDGAVNPNAETSSQQGPVSDEEAQRHERIAVAAYYNAERRGFREGGEQDDWLEAEKEIERQDRQRTSPARLQDEISSPDHMIPREPPP